MIGRVSIAVLLFCALAKAADVRDLSPAERLAYLQSVGISPAQLDALSRYEQLRAENAERVRLQQEQYEAELQQLENFEQQQLQEKYTVQEDVLQIPGEMPRQNDTYLCSAFKQPTDRYIVSFEAMADSHKIHHILLFGCEAPGIKRPHPAWECGEMKSGPQKSSQYVHASPCAGTPNILFAWGRDAPALELPEGVGFHVGGQSANQFLVLQVHYMHETTERDFSGVKISFTEAPQPRAAGTLLIVTGGEIAAKTRDTFEAACVVNEPVQLHPFAFRVHTHRHGEKVAGFVVREDESGKDEWTLIGERNPQLEQLFEPVKNKSLTINQGDVVAARCVINNNEKHAIQVGPTGEDEMCNFYVMYYVEDGESKPLRDNTCYSPGPPNYTWMREAGLNSIPKI